MVMDIKIHYDKAWGEKFGQAGIDKVKTHIQPWFCMPSLGTKIKLNVSIFFFKFDLQEITVTYERI